MCTTALAVVIGLARQCIQREASARYLPQGSNIRQKRLPSFIETLVNIFPEQCDWADVGSQYAAGYCDSAVFGFGVISVGEKGKPFADFVESANAISMVIMGNNHQVQPNRCFLPDYARSGGKRTGYSGQSAGGSAGRLCRIYHPYGRSIFVYGKTFGKISPLKFFGGMSPAMIMAFPALLRWEPCLLIWNAWKDGRKERSGKLRPAARSYNQYGRYRHLSGRLCNLYSNLLRH